MPEISRLFGIVIAMYYKHHPPPHFHARYRDHEGVIEITTGELVDGRCHQACLLHQNPG